MTVPIQPVAVLLFCLALGFLLGRVKVCGLPANSTLMTLIVAIAANLLLKQVGFSMHIPTALQTLGFAFFSFAVGFSAGPGFVDALCRDGKRPAMRLAALAIVYCLAAGVVAVVVVLATAGGTEGRTRGLLAGALTQATILDGADHIDPLMPVAYGVSYAAGVFWMIVFVQAIAPRLLGVSPLVAVKQHLDGLDRVSTPGFNLPARLLQMRAYRINAGSSAIGKSVGELEAKAPRRFEIVALHRAEDSAELGVSQETRLMAGDVMVAIGDMRVVSRLEFNGVEELTEDSYLSSGFVLADIVLSHDSSEVMEDLTVHGILLRSVARHGRILPERQLGQFRAGDVLKVAGLSRPVETFVRAHGYRRDDGAPLDLFLPVLAIAVAVVLGAISVLGYSLGSGFFSFGLGVLTGWINRRRPDIAHVSPSALSLLRALGLNVFIGCVALGAALTPRDTFSLPTLFLFVQASAIALVPLFATFAFARHVLRLQPVSLLGGLCGSGTCTPALNALEDETGSSAFTAAYAIPYVVGNFALTLLGSAVIKIL